MAVTPVYLTSPPPLFWWMYAVQVKSADGEALSMVLGEQADFLLLLMPIKPQPRTQIFILSFWKMMLRLFLTPLFSGELPEQNTLMEEPVGLTREVSFISRFAPVAVDPLIFLRHPDPLTPTT